MKIDQILNAVGLARKSEVDGLHRAIKNIEFVKQNYSDKLRKMERLQSANIDKLAGAMKQSGILKSIGEYNPQFNDYQYCIRIDLDQLNHIKDELSMQREWSNSFEMIKRSMYHKIEVDLTALLRLERF